MSRYVTVHTSVEIDLADIDTEDLLAELKRRGAGGLEDLPAHAGSMMDRLHVALKLDRADEALKLARDVVGAHLGVIL